MRRLTVTAGTLGVQELDGPATLTDSLVRANQDALQADNRTLIARNDTALSASGAGLHAFASIMSLIDPGTIDARNTIARGSTDALADPVTTGGIGCPCPGGVIDNGYSNVATTTGVTDLGHNQSADPQFVNPVAGDDHLRATSPAIDAGVNDPADGPTDLDGQPRVQGAAPDIGAYESTPVVVVAPGGSGSPPPPGSPPSGSSGPAPTAGAGGPADTTAPVISALSMTNRSFAVAAAARAATRRRRTPLGTALRFTLSEAATVTIAVVRETSGRVSRGRCVKATRRLAHAKRCTRATTVGTLVGAEHAGRASIAFSGRLRRHALARGHYRATVTAVDAAHNASKPRSVTFSVVAAAKV